ncbi:energy transducer TonB [Sphingomonas sediminicola]|uniref:energy transducer TonB n=1 Tax=Sphingomonas TaxID=13687 RepID=UPI003B589E8E
MFLLTFGADGRLSACNILQSSGNAMLDMATCRLSRQRVRVSATQPHVQFFQHHWS